MILEPSVSFGPVQVSLFQIHSCQQHHRPSESSTTDHRIQPWKHAANDSHHDSRQEATELGARFFQKLANMFPFGHRASNSADYNMVRNYVGTTDPKTAATSRAGLIAKCGRVLQGQATREMTKQAVETIRWKEKQTLIVRFILRNLFTRGLIMERFE